MTVEIVTDCLSWLARCECILPAGHAGFHACGCGGEWDHDGHAQALPIVEGIYTRRMILAEREADSDASR